jgi:large subunit ribosomal protein L24
MKIKKGDVVQILAGKDRGKQGRVLDALPRDGRSSSRTSTSSSGT